MASDFFVKIEGIDGESSDKAHSKWIEVISFSHGAMQNVGVGRATDVSGRGQFLPFRFTHLVDKATPKLSSSAFPDRRCPRSSSRSAALWQAPRFLCMR